MGAAVTAMLMKERHIVSAFERLGATTPERALLPDDVGVDSQGIGWRRLQKRAVIREAGGGRYYVDSDAWQASRRTRRFLVLAVLMVIVAVSLASALWTTTR